MLKFIVTFLTFLISFSFLIPTYFCRAYAADVTPVISARLLGGQYFFKNQESNLSGNAGILAAPAINFNDQWSLVPTLSASWRGTKSVQDLVGGGTLFQQTQDHAVSVKGIYTLNKRWQFKSGGGYRIQLLKETNDEKWGKGLYDFQKPSGNVESEWTYNKDSSVRIGYDLYWIDFRNFSSLESQQKDLGRENASAKTLNTFNHSPYLALRFALPFLNEQKARVESSYFYVFRNFDEQKVVLLSGDLSNNSRKDKNQIVSTNFTFPFVFSDNFKVLLDVKGAMAILDSDQNNYDAAKTQFNPNFYAYREYSCGNNFTFLLGDRPYILTSGFTYVRRGYNDRPIQDVSGTYGAEKIGINEYYANFGIAYPINKNFRVQALGNFGWSRSNMKYEKTYAYNYETFTYLAGITYEY